MPAPWTKRASLLPGCVEITLPASEDARGGFVKPFHRAALTRLGCEIDAAEVFYTRSQRNVLRGLHFQLPPHDHAKLVMCQSGEITDVVVDLRRESPSYGQHVAFRLNGSSPSAVFIPSGLAHGFFVHSASADVLYVVSSEHAPTHDSGIRWDSAGIDWRSLTAADPSAEFEPIVSARDAALTPFTRFESPFAFHPEQPS